MRETPIRLHCVLFKIQSADIQEAWVQENV